MNEYQVSKNVRERWAGMTKRMQQEDYLPLAWLAPLVAAFSQHPRIGQLYPYTSHQLFCLSRTTKYPWSADCPHIEAIAENRFRVYGTKYLIVVGTYKEYRWKEAEYEVLGEGGISEAVLWADAALPTGCGPAINGNFEDLRRLEGKSVTPTAVKDLHRAVIHGDIEAVSLLLAAGADIDATEYERLTPLMVAVLGQNSAMVRLLLEKGANIHLTTHEGESALSLAAFDGKRAEIVRILKSAGAVE